MISYSYGPKVTVDILPAHYFDGGVVAFTRLDGHVAMPEMHRVPYEKGVHSWPFVLAHEEMHNRIEESGGVQDERGINDHVAYQLGRRGIGHDRFPFPSY